MYKKKDQDKASHALQPVSFGYHHPLRVTSARERKRCSAVNMIVKFEQKKDQDKNGASHALQPVSFWLSSPLEGDLSQREEEMQRSKHDSKI